ncbi:hypothetical protein ACQPW1_09845 [Nocardia sp. CA-128927]|uniref:hypothetical protein n=1 Tax=Nocardia sp. CA-128927 TaxID=3239975 RepID=UPI003D97A316
MTAPRTGQIDIYIPRATTPAALDAVVRLHVESALCEDGEWPARIERSGGYEHSPGVMCWSVTYVTGPREAVPTHRGPTTSR